MEFKYEMSPVQEQVANPSGLRFERNKMDILAESTGERTPMTTSAFIP